MELQEYLDRRVAAFEWRGGVCETCGSEQDLFLVSGEELSEPDMLSMASLEQFWEAVDRAQLLCAACRDRRGRE
jgi:hypothetical protein